MSGSDPVGDREAEIEAVAKALVRAAAPRGILAPRRSAEAAIAALDAVRSSGSAGQNQDQEAVARLTAELQALVDWFNDAPFLRAERLLYELAQRERHGGS